MQQITYQNEIRMAYQYIDIPLIAKLKAGSIIFEAAHLAAFDPINMAISLKTP